MIAILLAVAVAATPVEAAPAESAIDAERAFAADAQKLGQWTAFRKWASDRAVMFTPQPVNAHEFLKDRKDPPVAVFWWPGRSYVSCDGTLAVNTGPWVREGGKVVGYFTTVWQRQPDGTWKWIYDGGEVLNIPRAEGGDIKPKLASCEGEPIDPANFPPPLDAFSPWKSSGRAVSPRLVGWAGDSPDGSLRWEWAVGPKGDRHFIARIWNGHSFDKVIDDQVGARPQ